MSSTPISAPSFLLSPNINLPLPILLHALGLATLGLYLVFSSPPNTSLKKPPTTMLGITTTGLGLAYLITSYMPPASNQFLHASVPARIILAMLAAVRLPAARKEERNPLLITAIYDGLGGLFVGYWLGRWDGRAPL
jgi:hypothetical protein